MRGFGFAIDRGGTFTDVCVFKPDGSTRVLKASFDPSDPCECEDAINFLLFSSGTFQGILVLSEDPANYNDAPTEAIRQVLEQESGVPIPRGVPVPT
ncbi:hypothetical protein NECAME_11928, partial [Necator americanus]